MSKHTIIVLTDSPVMSAQIVSAVNTLSEGEDLARRTAEVDHFVHERGLSVPDIIATERREARRRIHVLKFKACTFKPLESKKLHVESRFPVHAACLKIPSELGAIFVIEDLRFDTVGIYSESVSKHIAPSTVPAAAYSDESMASVDLDIECQGSTLVVKNVTKKQQVFTAEIIGFRKD
jgi:hypothetical protein